MGTAKHGGSKKVGRDKEKCARYRNAHTRERNKIKRVLQSCGLKFATKWADSHGVKLPVRSVRCQP